MLDFDAALALCSRLVALSIALQALEMIALRSAFSARGVFPSKSRAYAKPSLLDVLSGTPTRIVCVLALQLGVASYLVLVGSSALFLVLLATYLLVIARVGGPFNGGSDAMSALSLLTLAIAGAFPSGLGARAALGYLGAQTLLSYFLAGIAKAKQPGWWRGSALVHFVNLPKYAVPDRARTWLAKPPVACAASWAVLLFECSFPLALLAPRVCLAYLACGACFHLANAALFGLNRFLFSWLAVYPVLLWLSQYGPLVE